MILSMIFISLMSHSAESTIPDQYSDISESEYYLRYSMNQTPDAKWSYDAYLRLPEIWGRPDIQVGSTEFYSEFLNRYGLHEKVSEDKLGSLEDNLPLGLIFTEKNYKNKNKADYKFGYKGLTVSCDACHSTKIGGERIIGIGNPFFNGERLYLDLYRADGKKTDSVGGVLPFSFNPGTSLKASKNQADFSVSSPA